MGKEFDDLAKSFATGVSRREALRRFGAALAGGAVATVLPWRASQAEAGPFVDDPCVIDCRKALPPGQQDSCLYLCNQQHRECTKFCIRSGGPVVGCLQQVRKCDGMCIPAPEADSIRVNSDLPLFDDRLRVNSSLLRINSSFLRINSTLVSFNGDVQVNRGHGIICIDVNATPNPR